MQGLSIREKCGQYYLIEELAKKYSHSTFLASPTDEPECQVILTVFTASLFSSRRERENLLQQAQCIRQLQNPHLVPILDMGIEGEQPFVVCEYLANASLRSRLKKIFPQRLELQDALTIVLQVGEVLARAHEHNIFHGNIKPENILFDANNQAVLANFHLVNRKDAIIRDQTSEEYAFCYMAPEQFAGTSDARSDQYALGCLTYELITGGVPFAAQSLSSMMGETNNTRPIPLSESVADLPPALETAILKTLAKDPDERFFDFSLFLEVIRSILSPPPAFPLMSYNRSSKNRAISHPVQSIKAGSISSPIRKRAAKRAVPPVESPASVLQSHFVTSQQADLVGDKENDSPDQPLPDQDCKESSTTMLEMILQSEDFTSELAIPTQTVEENQDAVWLTNSSSVEQEMNEQPVLALANSVHEHNEDATTEMASLLASKSPVNGPSARRRRPKVKTILKLVLLSSVIVALGIYAFWSFEMPTLGGSVQTIRKQMQVLTPQWPIRVTQVATVQPGVQATQTVTVKPGVQVAQVADVKPGIQSVQAAQAENVKPGVQATQAAIVKPRVWATQAATVQSPTPTPTPTPMPTSYEAESSQNTLGAGMTVFDCSGCSGGKKAGDLVNGNNNQGTLQFNNIWEPSAGNYTLTVYYVNGFQVDKSTDMQVNGVDLGQFTEPSTGNWDTAASFTYTVSLNAGNNTILFQNPAPYGLNFDRIVV